MTYRSQALTKNSSSCHVLFLLEFGEVQRRCEDQDVRQGQQTMQESNCHSNRQALAGLNDVQLALKQP
jgi:hypothetical protein